MNKPNQLFGQTIDQIKHTQDLSFKTSAEGVDCTITSKSLKSIFDDAIVNEKAARQKMEAYAQSIGYSQKHHRENYESADAKGKRSFTKIQKKFENSYEVANWSQRNNQVWTIKSKVTQMYYECIRDHHIGLANQLFKSIAGYSGIIDEAKTKEIYEGHYRFAEVTLENSPLFELRETHEALKNAGLQGLTLRIEFDHTDRCCIQCVKLYDGETLYYIYKLTANTVRKEDEHHAYQSSETKSFDLSDTLAEKGPIATQAKLLAMSSICQVLLAFELNLTEMATKQLYLRAYKSVFKIVSDADTSQ